MLVRRWDFLDSPLAAPPNPSRTVPPAAGAPGLLLPEDSAFAQRKERFPSGRKDSPGRTAAGEGRRGRSGAVLLETCAWERWGEQT